MELKKSCRKICTVYIHIILTTFKITKCLCTKSYFIHLCIKHIYILCIKLYNHLYRCRKAFDEIQPLWMYFNIIKAIYNKSTSNIILDSERLKAFPVWSGTRQRCLFLPLLVNIALEFLARAIKQEKKLEPFQIGKKEAKLLIYEWHNIIYTKS